MLEYLKESVKRLKRFQRIFFNIQTLSLGGGGENFDFRKKNQVAWIGVRGGG